MLTKMDKKLNRKSPKPAREVHAEYLKERIYGGVTLAGINFGLLLRVDSISVKHAALTVIGTALGLWLAMMYAHFVAYRVVHDKNITKGEFLHSIIVQRGVIVAAVPTLLFLSLAALGAIELKTALIIDIAVAAVGLIVLTTRSAKTETNNIKMAAIIALLQAAVAVGIILFKTFSH